MIHIKAQQTVVKFNKDENDPGQLLYVMRPETYSRLAENKVISEAAVRSGIQRGALKGAWDAIGEVIKAWVTEGHSVAIPGLGSLRFSMNADAVADVNDVAKSLIRSRKVVFTPSVDIKNELKQTKVSISCYDVNGNEVKRVTDDSENEEVEDGENHNGNGGSGSGSQTTLTAPTIGGTSPFAESTQVTISGPSGAEIRYTTDGSTPTSASSLYSAAITLSDTATVKAIAIKDGQSSEVTTKVFTKSSGSGDAD
ncbi:MAG: chitobiase/beta-hexosaminidase C-terminal domain-containing protein [Bacteroidaceae bacterium]|nr:chitobiase/beta-hexosaminidase C-terminal domain-containing protein [Bacteroidaceae bacterium]